MVRSWFMERVGHNYEGVDARIIDMHATVFGDDDDRYHEAYLLDEDDAFYTGAWVGDGPVPDRGYISL